MALNFSLTPELEELKLKASALARDFAKRAPEHDRDRSAPLENYEKLREEGFFGLVIPKKYGGLGLGFLGWVVAAEELAQGCASTALAFNMHINATGAILEHPDIPESMKQRVADLAIREGKLMCTIVSEPTSSSHLATSYTPSLRAVKVPGGYRLYGQKAFASVWEDSDLAFLYAHPEDDPNPQASIGFLAPTKGEGIAVEDWWHTLGMRATRSQKVTFDGFFVPEECVLHRTDAFLNSFIVSGAAWSFGGYTAVYLGVGMGILNFAKEMLARRIAKGYAQPMGYHPDIRRRVTEMVCDLEAAKWSLWHAAWCHERYGPTPGTFVQFVKAKYLVGRAVANATRHAVVACGIHALFKDYPLERMIRDGATAPVMPPNEDACLSLIGLLEMGLNPDEALPPLKVVGVEGVK